MRLNVIGPFEIEAAHNGDLIPRSLSSWWEEVDSDYSGLSTAKGCYVFAIRTSGGNTYCPWYVGKTNNQTFRGECFKPHQRTHYLTALNRYRRAKPFLFLLPLTTPNGKYSSKNSSGVIDFVEKYLIGLALRANDELLNISDTRLYRDIIIPGFLNSPQGNLGSGAKALRDTLIF